MISQILQSSAILLVVSLGGLISERGGILNIGLEGMIGVGAFFAVAAASFGVLGSAALLVGMVAGGVAAALFALFALRWKANPFIVGLAINVLAAGALPLLSETFFESRGALRVPSATLGVTPVVVVAITTAIAAHIFLYHTVHGVRLRIAGEQPEWMRSQQLGVRRYQLIGLIVSGLLSGLSGALLALRLGVYIPNISSGRGWIALVIVYLGYRSPAGLVGAALFFGAIEALSVRAQSVLGVPPTVLLALPYVLTVIAFVSYSAFRTSRVRR